MKKPISVVLLFAIAILAPLSILPVQAATASAFNNHVVFVIMENHPLSAITQSAAPYMYSLENQYAQSNNYVGPVSSTWSPSLPNYIGLTSGSTQGIIDDNGPSSHPIGAANIIDRFSAASITWKFYMENMPSNCWPSDSGSTDPQGNKIYQVHHNPIPYYTDSAATNGCANYDVPAGPTSCPQGAASLSDIANLCDSNLITDLNNTAPNFMWLTPNMCNDSHDSCVSGKTSVQESDTYLSYLVPSILTSRTFESDSTAIIIITYDEPSTGTYGTEPVYFAVAGPGAKLGFASSIHYTHLSLLAGWEKDFKLSCIVSTGDCAAINMADFSWRGNFGACGSLPLGWSCNLNSQGSTGFSTIDSKGTYHSILSNVGGGSSSYAYATAQKGTFPWSPCQAPASGVLGQTSGRIAAMFDPLSLPATTTGRFDIYLGLYYWLPDGAKTAHGQTYQCLATEVRAEFKNGDFTRPTNSTDFSATYNLGENSANAFGWNRTIGSVSVGNYYALVADVGSQCKQDEIAWGIPTSATCVLSGVEIGVEGFGFTTETLNVVWGAQMVETQCHNIKGDINEDGAINILDLANEAFYFSSEVGTTVYTTSASASTVPNNGDSATADATLDGQIVIGDLALTAFYINTKCQL